MAIFRYKALSEAGEEIFGQLDAESERQAARKLQEQGHYPISFQMEAAPRPAFLKPRGGKIDETQVGALILHLASLVGAGVPVDRALYIMRETATHRALKPVVNALLTDVRSGLSLSDSLSKMGEKIPAFYVATIRASEEGGFLPEALKRLAAHHGKTRTLRDSLRSALVYPIILLAMSSLAILFILTIVLPQFRVMFDDAGIDLPLPAAVVMAVSGFMEDYSMILMLIAAACMTLALFAFRSPALHNRLSDFVLRLPVAGDIVTRFELAKFCSALGMLLDNGTPLQQGLTLAEDVVRNNKLSHDIHQCSEQVREGLSLAEALTANGFPATISELVRVGEETGQLPPALGHLAEMLDQEVRHSLERAVAYLVPVITIALGAIIALVIASVFSALISINELAV